MKTKFLSAILLGGLLAASTGTFVSCKDYDDDITDLQEQIDKLSSLDALKANITDMQSAIATAQSSAEAKAAAAQTVADAAKASAQDAASAAKAAQDAVEALKNSGVSADAISEAQKAADAAQKAAENAQATADDAAKAAQTVADEAKKTADALVELEKRVKALEESASSLDSGSTTLAADIKKLSEELASAKKELTSLLGDNLQSLVFIPQLYLDGIEATRYPFATGIYQTLVATKVTGKTNDGAAFTINKNNSVENLKKDNKDVTFFIGGQNTASYHINPTSANIDGVNWGFLYAAPEFVATRANQPSFNFVSAKENGGDIEVTYTIDNADLLKAGGDDNVSVFALTGTYKAEENDTTVTSDYAAILPQEVSLKYIAFKNIKTKESTNCKLERDLYLKGENAAQQEASLKFPYDGGDKQLKDYLEVHYTTKDLIGEDAKESDYKVMAYDDVAKYGLHFEYELLEYITGDNKTEENAYAQIDAQSGKFTPCYVDTKGNTVPCGTSDKEGISAVGRTPIVLVKLMEGKNLVLAGYAKVEITEEEETIDDTVTLPVVKDGEVAYVCSGEVKITWADMTGKILEPLKTTKEKFQTKYTLSTDKFYLLKDEKYVEDTNNTYGKVVNGPDTKVPTTNDVFAWEGNEKQIAAIYALTGHSITLYAKYENGNDIYIPVTIKVLDKPGASFGEKIKGYWYPTTKEVAERDTVRVNVPAPADDADVTKYVKDLNEYFVGQAVKVSFTGANADKYKDQTISYKFQFSATQPKVGNYQLAADASRLTLQTTVDTKTYDVATIDEDGILTYADNDIAKEILNLYGHLVPSHFANIDIVASYGDCDIALATESFKARFLRPVDVLDGDQAKFEDAEANGSSIVLGDLFSLKDWREKAIVVKNAEGEYEAVEDNGVDLYAYYEFKSLAIDFGNAETDISGTRMKISELSGKDKELIIKLTASGDSGVSTDAKTNIATVTLGEDVDPLNNVTITYKNNGANAQDFNIWIPVELTYSWGTVKAEAKVAVAHTIANK